MTIIILLKKQQKKLALTSLYFFSQETRNVIGQFLKVYLHRLIKILQFLARERIKKCLT